MWFAHTNFLCLTTQSTEGQPQPSISRQIVINEDNWPLPARCKHVGQQSSGKDFSFSSFARHKPYTSHCSKFVVLAKQIISPSCCFRPTATRNLFVRNSSQRRRQTKKGCNNVVLFSREGFSRRKALPIKNAESESGKVRPFFAEKPFPVKVQTDGLRGKRVLWC